MSSVAASRRVTSKSALASRSRRSVSANSRAFRMARAACPTKAIEEVLLPSPEGEGLGADQRQDGDEGIAQDHGNPE